MTRTVILTTTRRKRLTLAQPAATPVAPVDATPLNQTQAAALLGISREHLSRMTSGGDVPHHKLGKLPRYFHDELNEWLRSR